MWPAQTSPYQCFKVSGADGNAITGAWEKRLDRDWEHDFALTYRRAG
jgi:hypothetical protein